VRTRPKFPVSYQEIIASQFKGCAFCRRVRETLAVAGNCFYVHLCATLVNLYPLMESISPSSGYAPLNRVYSAIHTRISSL
jgi:hypothetical protein